MISNLSQVGAELWQLPPGLRLAGGYLVFGRGGEGDQKGGLNSDWPC